MRNTFDLSSQILLQRTRMIRFRTASCNMFFSLRPRRNLTSCPLPLERSVPSTSATLPDKKELCFSLAERLIGRGLFSLAQKVITRIISQCSSVSEVISTFDFARLRGMKIDSFSYSFLIRKLVVSGEAELAEYLYVNDILSEGVEIDFSLMDSMIFCYCELGKLDEAKSCFEKVIRMKYVPCSGACSAFIKQFCVEGRELEGYDYFVKISDAGVSLSFGCYGCLVRNLCHRGYLDEALNVFDIMCNNGVPPTVNLFKSLIFGLCKRGRVEEAELFSTEMESYGSYLDKVIYTSLIYEYCRKKKMKMALRLLLRMFKMGCEPDNYTFNTLVHGFLNLGLFDKAWALHNMMAESGLEPDIATYQIMISKYCKDRKVDCGLTLLNNMVKCNMTPNVHCYTVLIAALFKENRLQEINELYKMMLDNRLVPDHVLFFTLIKSHPKGSEMQLALTVVRGIAENGCGIDLLICLTADSSKSTGDIMHQIECLLEKIVAIDSSLAEMAFSIYMIALCCGGKLDAALSCIDKIVYHGFLPLLSAYNALIKCLYQEGLVEDVKSLIGVMQGQGLVPDRSTFLIMADEQCKLGDFASAFDILDQMEEKGVRPGVEIYDSIIGHLGREHRIFEAEILFNRMQEAHIEPDETFYATMINAYSKSGQAIKAHRLFEKMLENGVRPSSHSYTALINGLIKKNMTEEGCQYIDRMLEEGIMPNTALYTSLINQFLRKSEFDFAFRLYDLMDKSQIEKDLVTYITLVSGVCRNIRCIGEKRYTSQKSEKANEMLFNLLHQQILLPEDKELKGLIRSQREMKFCALKFIQKIQNLPYMPNLYLYNCLISGFCWAQRMQDAYSHFDLMQKEGVLPNQVTFTILIDGHMRFGETDCAVQLFNGMSASGYTADRILYNTLIRGLCRSGRFLDALSVTHMMQKRGLSPSHNSYENLLSSLCANYLSGHALMMLGHGHTPCYYNLNWLIRLLSEENKLHEAHLVHDILLLKERSLPIQRFNWSCIRH